MMTRMKAHMRRLNPDLVATLALVVAGILFFSDFLFSSKNLYFRDILNFHYPLRRALIDAYAHGEFPLWNPFVYLGQPMLANPNYMAFYPTNLFHLILPFNYAFKLHFIIHPMLAGIGAYFLNRRLGIGCLAALVGATAYEFSGVVLSFLNLYNIVPAVALLPWIGWAFLGALRRRWLIRTLLLGLLLALQAIAFEPLVFQCVLWLIAGLGFYHLVESDNRLRELGAMVRTGSLAAFFALGLSAVQVLPTLELFPLSSRGALDFATMSRWSTHPLDLVNALVPNLFGTYYTLGLVDSWGELIHDGSENYLVSCFLGSCTLLLAFLSFAHERIRLRLVLVCLSFVSLFFAMGRYNPVYEWLFDNVPLFTLGRYPSKYLLLGALALSSMAALGAEAAVLAARRRDEKPGIAKFAMVGAFAAATIIGCWRYLSTHASQLESWLRLESDPANNVHKNFPGIIEHVTTAVLSSGLFMLVTSLLILAVLRWRLRLPVGALLLLLTAVELAPANLRLSPLISGADIDFVPEVNRFIREKGPAEAFRVAPPTLLHRMPDLRLRMPNRSVAWLTLFHRMSGQPFYAILGGIEYSVDRSVDYLNTIESEELWRLCNRLPQASALTLLQRTNSPLVLSMEELKDPRLQQLAHFENLAERPVQAYWLKDTLSRAYFASGVAYARSPADALHGLVHPEFPAGNTVILEGSGRPVAGVSGAGSVRPIVRESAHLEYDVEATIPGHLVVLDSYYPGWTAYMDDKEVKIERANYAFRAVDIPIGKHRVRMSYQPTSFFSGLAITAAFTLAGLITIFLAARSRRRTDSMDIPAA